MHKRCVHCYHTYFKASQLFSSKLFIYLFRWLYFTYLADFHVDTAIVLTYVEIKVLVVDTQVPALGQLTLETVTQQHPLKRVQRIKQIRKE